MTRITREASPPLPSYSPPHPPPPYSRIPPIISGSRAFFPTPPPSYRTAPSVVNEPIGAASSPSTKGDRDERTPLLSHTKQKRSRRRKRGRQRKRSRTSSSAHIDATASRFKLPSFKLPSVEPPVCNGICILLALLSVVGIIFLIKAHLPPPREKPTFTVAIIGAGPAGIAAAQHLLTSSAVKGVKLNITLFESKPVIGGALAFHDDTGRSLHTMDDPMQDPITAEDIAGPALMWNNGLFTQDSERILGDRVRFIERGSERVGYYNWVSQRRADLVRPYGKMPLTTKFRLWIGYGSSIWDAHNWAREGILTYKTPRVPLVPDVEQIVWRLGFSEPLRLQASDAIKKRHISGDYARDILEPQIQRAYGQSLSQVNGFAAMVAAAQEETANTYMGGNLVDRLQRIAQKLELDVRTSTHVAAIKHSTNINPIKPNGTEEEVEHPGWLIQHESADEEGNRILSTEAFDRVIMASMDMGMRVENDEGIALNMTSFHENMDESEAAALEINPTMPVHVAFFTTDRKIPFFDHEGQVLFLNSARASGMREVAFVRDVVTFSETTGVKTEYLYRVLADGPALQRLQTRARMSWSYETVIQNAYSILFPLTSDFPPFELPWAKGFWWTSVMNHAAMSVDLSWLSGKVVAEALIKDVVTEAKNVI